MLPRPSIVTSEASGREDDSCRCGSQRVVTVLTEKCVFFSARTSIKSVSKSSLYFLVSSLGCTFPRRRSCILTCANSVWPVTALSPLLIMRRLPIPTHLQTYGRAHQSRQLLQSGAFIQTARALGGPQHTSIEYGHGESVCRAVVAIAWSIP